MAAVNRFFQKMPEIKIWHHFVIEKPAANLYFLQGKFFADAPYWNNDFFVFSSCIWEKFRLQKVGVAAGFLITKWCQILISGTFWKNLFSAAIFEQIF